MYVDNLAELMWAVLLHKVSLGLIHAFSVSWRDAQGMATWPHSYIWTLNWIPVISEMAESLSPSLYYLCCLVGGKRMFLE